MKILIVKNLKYGDNPFWGFQKLKRSISLVILNFQVSVFLYSVFEDFNNLGLSFFQHISNHDVNDLDFNDLNILSMSFLKILTFEDLYFSIFQISETSNCQI